MSRNDQSTPSRTWFVALPLAKGPYWRDAAEHAGQAQAWKQIGGRDADACSGRVQPLFGSRDVGTAAQYLARRARVDTFRCLRHEPRRVEFGDQRLGRLSGEHRKPMLVDGDAGLVDCDARRRRFELRACAGRIEIGAASGAQTCLDQIECFALVDGVVACNPQTRLLTAQVDVCSGNVAGNRDAYRADIGGAGRGFGALRLDASAHTAKQIQLPAGIDAGSRQRRVALIARRAERLVLAHQLMADLRASRVGRVEIEAGVAQHRVRRVVARDCELQVVVRIERAVDQRAEPRIAEAVPEDVVRCCACGTVVMSRLRRGRRARKAIRCSRRRSFVVGADRACGQRERQHQRGQACGCVHERSPCNVLCCSFHTAGFSRVSLRIVT